ncbi:MAG: PPC domain-containing protein, partial [Phaeodactylibacter sp.]|nr:PPC domain-containing protein [Phaeodactylibacter sp.]
MNLRITIPLLVTASFFFISAAAQEVFYQEDFADGAPDWSVIQIVGNGANSGFWRTTSTGPAGSFALDPLNSTTASNGWVQFDSDLNCFPQGQDSWLVSPYIQTEGRMAIILSFETYYRTYNDRPQLRVGEDFSQRINWDIYEPFPSLSANQYGGATEGDPALNPQYIQIDITPSIVGLDSFRFAFQFLSSLETLNGGGDDIGCAYSWQVDDIQLLSVQEISCGEVLLSDNFSSNISLYDYSECVSGPPIIFPDLPDQLYRFELADQQTVRVALQDYTGSGMLSILESDVNNVPGSCVATNFFGALPDNQEVIAVLDPGVYWIVVNGFEQGAYSLSVDCYPADNPGVITCGESLIGSTADSPNSFSGSAYINCLGGLFAYGAGENRYQFTLTETQTIVANLSNRGNLDLDLFLFSNLNGQPWQCLDASYINYAGADEEIIAQLAAGTYWLIVDGDLDTDA